VYVGLYGYDYLTAGKRVVSLFQQRGWTTIINDDLVSRVLTLFNIVLALLTGCFGLWLNSVKPSWLDEFGSSAIFVAFGLPFIVGWALSNILTSVVASAVDTVVVGFAEAPMEFERNHPGLYTAMISAWQEVYPEEFGL
jgi:biotin transporter BioY